MYTPPPRLNKPIPVAPLPQAEAERVKSDPRPEVVAEPVVFDPESFDNADPFEQDMALEEAVPFEELADAGAESSAEAMPALSDVEDRVPQKTKALMEELFRARLDSVKPIDRKKIY